MADSFPHARGAVYAPGPPPYTPPFLRETAGRITASARQPETLAVVAAGTALAASSLVVFGVGARGFVTAFFVTVLVVLARIDFKRRILPNIIVLPAAGIVASAQIAFFPDRALEWIGASVGAAIVLLVPLLVYPKGMGMGDVKLGLLLGAGLGGSVFSAIVLGFVLVFPFALLVIARGGLAARKTALPFGPFLAAGAIIVVFAGSFS
jgi:leader peptidase (prepilin peptidase)/N-methyltransferase